MDWRISTEETGERGDESGVNPHLGTKAMCSSIFNSVHNQLK